MIPLIDTCWIDWNWVWPIQPSLNTSIPNTVCVVVLHGEHPPCQRIKFQRTVGSTNFFCPQLSLLQRTFSNLRQCYPAHVCFSFHTQINTLKQLHKVYHPSNVVAAVILIFLHNVVPCFSIIHQPTGKAHHWSSFFVGSALLHCQNIAIFHVLSSQIACTYTLHGMSLWLASWSKQQKVSASKIILCSVCLVPVSCFGTIELMLWVLQSPSLQYSLAQPLLLPEHVLSPLTLNIGPSSNSSSLPSLSAGVGMMVINVILTSLRLRWWCGGCTVFQEQHWCWKEGEWEPLVTKKLQHFNRQLHHFDS